MTKLEKITLYVAIIGAITGVLSLSWQIYKDFQQTAEILDSFIEASMDDEKQEFSLDVRVRNLSQKDVYIRWVYIFGESVQKDKLGAFQKPILPSQEKFFHIGTYPYSDSDKIIKLLGKKENSYIVTTRDTKITCEPKYAWGLLILSDLKEKVSSNNANSADAKSRAAD